MRRVGATLTAFALAVGVVACDRTPDKSAAVTSEKSAAAKPELTPTAPAIGAPPANPPPVMPPAASAALEQSNPAPQPPGTTPVDSGGAKPDPAQTAQGGDPSAKQPMKEGEESTAMPKPAQANDHSTLATDGKQ